MCIVCVNIFMPLIVLLAASETSTEENNNEHNTPLFSLQNKRTNDDTRTTQQIQPQLLIHVYCTRRTAQDQHKNCSLEVKKHNTTRTLIREGETKRENDHASTGLD